MDYGPTPHPGFTETYEYKMLESQNIFEFIDLKVLALSAGCNPTHDDLDSSNRESYLIGNNTFGLSS